MTDSPDLHPTRDNILRLKSRPLFCDMDEVAKLKAMRSIYI